MNHHFYVFFHNSHTLVALLLTIVLLDIAFSLDKKKKILNFCSSLLRSVTWETICVLFFSLNLLKWNCPWKIPTFINTLLHMPGIRKWKVSSFATKMCVLWDNIYFHHYDAIMTAKITSWKQKIRENKTIIKFLLLELTYDLVELLSVIVVLTFIFVSSTSCVFS